MAKAKKEEVVEKTADETVETKGATEDGKLKVKAKPSMKKMTTSDEPIKVDMTQPKEEEQKQEDDKIVEEVQEKVEEEKVEEKEETEQPVLEEVTDEKTDEDVEDKVEAVKGTVEEAVAKSEETGQELPENIQRVVDFMNETGGDLEDYVKLNQDYSKLNEEQLLREYYQQTKPHLNNEEINFLMEDQFSYDKDSDEDNVIKRKKLAFKEQVAGARTHLDGLKSKYYEEIKAGSKLTQDQQKAVDFFNRYNKENEVTQKAEEKQKSVFLEKTNNVFNDKFKGFEYNVGEKRYRFNVKDVSEVKTTQSDLNNFVGKFLDKRNNTINDATGYHKSLFTAMNADAVANHFYEQGKSDGIKESIAGSKNVDMNPRSAHEKIEAGGLKMRVVSGDDTNKLRFKIKQ
jgi:hypothetical protein